MLALPPPRQDAQAGLASSKPLTAGPSLLSIPSQSSWLGHPVPKFKPGPSNCGPSSWGPYPPHFLDRMSSSRPASVPLSEGFLGLGPRPRKGLQGKGWNGACLGGGGGIWGLRSRPSVSPVPPGFPDPLRSEHCAKVGTKRDPAHHLIPAALRRAASSCHALSTPRPPAPVSFLPQPFTHSQRFAEWPLQVRCLLGAGDSTTNKKESLPSGGSYSS